MTDGVFCEDLVREIDSRTNGLLEKDYLSFTEKMTALSSISAYRLEYDPRTVETMTVHAAHEGITVAALVIAPEIPLNESVFIGKLKKDVSPLKLSTRGLWLSVESGLIARVETNNNGRNVRFNPTERLDDEIEPVKDKDLIVVGNTTVPAFFVPSNATPLADNTLVRHDGLDFKICKEGVNMPGLTDEGKVSDSYDRMGLVTLFGAEKYRQILNIVNSGILAKVTTL